MALLNSYSDEKMLISELEPEQPISKPHRQSWLKRASNVFGHAVKTSQGKLFHVGPLKTMGSFRAHKTRYVNPNSNEDSNDPLLLDSTIDQLNELSIAFIGDDSTLRGSEPQQHDSLGLVGVPPNNVTSEPGTRAAGHDRSMDLGISGARQVRPSSDYSNDGGFHHIGDEATHSKSADLRSNIVEFSPSIPVRSTLRVSHYPKFEPTMYATAGLIEHHDGHQDYQESIETRLEAGSGGDRFIPPLDFDLINDSLVDAIEAQFENRQPVAASTNVKKRQRLTLALQTQRSAVTNLTKTFGRGRHAAAPTIDFRPPTPFLRLATIRPDLFHSSPSRGEDAPRLTEKQSVVSCLSSHFRPRSRRSAFCESPARSVHGNPPSLASSNPAQKHFKRQFNDLARRPTTLRKWGKARMLKIKRRLACRLASVTGSQDS